MSIHRFALAAASMMATGLFAQSPAPATRVRPAKDNPADWPMYTRDLAGTRFSPLAEINTKNVSRLKVAWSVTLGLAPAGVGRRGADPAAEAPPAAAESRGPAGPRANAEATPIVVRGILYLPAGNRILALDAETGTQVWTAPLPFSTNARRRLLLAGRPGESASHFVHGRSAAGRAQRQHWKNRSGLRQGGHRRYFGAVGWHSYHLQQRRDCGRQQRREPVRPAGRYPRL